MTDHDLTIDDLLADPMTHAIMQADRVDPSELATMLRALAPLVARAAGRSGNRERDGECAPSDRRNGPKALRSTGCGGRQTSRRVAPGSSLQPQYCGAR
jgi:hypothetical protein